MPFSCTGSICAGSWNPEPFSDGLIGHREHCRADVGHAIEATGATPREIQIGTTSLRPSDAGDPLIAGSTQGAGVAKGKSR